MGMIPIKLEANTLRNVIGMRSMSVRAGGPVGRPAGREDREMRQQRKVVEKGGGRAWRWRAFTSRYLIPRRGGLSRPEEAEKRGPRIDFLRCAAPPPPAPPTAAPPLPLPKAEMR